MAQTVKTGSVNPKTKVKIPIPAGFFSSLKLNFINLLFNLLRTGLVDISTTNFVRHSTWQILWFYVQISSKKKSNFNIKIPVLKRLTLSTYFYRKINKFIIIIINKNLVLKNYLYQRKGFFVKSLWMLRGVFMNSLWTLLTIKKFFGVLIR